MQGHNHIYDRLVGGPDDAIGALAYCLYKKSKQEYCRAFETTHGRAPTLSELAPFHQANIGTSILVNVLTVIVVGVIALGSREYSSLTSAIGTRVSAEQK